MDLYAETVRDFGRRLGLDALEPAASGLVDLTIENTGRLQIESANTADAAAVTVALARPWPRHAENAARKALELCHWRENHPWPINAVARDGEWIIFVAAIPLERLDVPTLDAALSSLSALLDSVEKAG